MRLVVPCGLALFCSLATSPARADVEETRPTDNWNQWDEPMEGGVSEGMRKLSLGASYAATAAEGTWAFELEGEALLTDRWGLRTHLSFPLSSRADALWVPTFAVGPTFHLIPRAVIDPFLSMRGGLAWPFEDGSSVKLAPYVGASAGLAVYFWGLFFAQVEGGYQLTAVAQPARYVDLAGPFVALRWGLAL